MKLLRFLFLALISFTACGKEESFEQPKNSAKFFMKVDGNDWSADKQIIVLDEDGLLKLTGINNDGVEFSIQLVNPAVGETILTFQQNGIAYLYDPARSVDVAFSVYEIEDPEADAPLLKVNITEYDQNRGYISGTFEGLLYNPQIEEYVAISNGEFQKLRLPGFSDDDGDPTNPPVDNDFPGSGKATWKVNGQSYSGNATWVSNPALENMFSIVVTTGDNKQLLNFALTEDGNTAIYGTFAMLIDQVPLLVKGTPSFSITDFNFGSKKIKLTFSADLSTMSGDQEYKLTDLKVNVGF